jgi:hypothetical protein
MIAIFLSVLAYREPRFCFAASILSKAFLLWIGSMIVLDIGVVLVGVIVGYNPPYIACVMFLLIQGMYILSGVNFYIKSKVEGDYFNAISAKRRLRYVTHQAIFLSTFALGISFVVEPGIIVFLPAFTIAGLMWLLDKVFTKLLEKSRLG